MMSPMVDSVLTAGYARAFTSTVLACSTACVLPFVPTLMASTPRLSSRVAGTFAAGQVIVVASVPNRGPSNPSAGNFTVAAPAGQRPRAGTVASCAHETTPAGTGLVLPRLPAKARNVPGMVSPGAARTTSTPRTP